MVADLALVVDVARKQAGARRDHGRIAIRLGTERRRGDGVAIAREAIPQKAETSTDGLAALGRNYKKAHLDTS
ncbi:hypothetical protein A245_47625 [Pseudomonas syringae pv. actinidiae ICMP 19096]|uniref:Uncharacterized protein n=1 Tax=Pseudomonas syringae pv. actinidiae ICMP 19096 TaxID=1194405 RepID=A0A656JIH2_PSESF|nr:hypothetical protein A245_47625 [Pseudomonas syringae pv. actinidiae ICMP 19096]